MKMDSGVGRMMSRLMISCFDATFLISRAELDKLRFKDNMNLVMHLMGCKYCRRYKHHIKAISGKLKKYNSDIEQGNYFQKLSPKQRSDIQSIIDSHRKF